MSALPTHQATSLYNQDLAPTTAAHRTWGTYNYIALWFSMSMEVTTYMLASSLIAGGMNWKQAVATILPGNLPASSASAPEASSPDSSASP